MSTNPTAPEQNAYDTVPPDNFSVSLCISGDALDPDDISRTLGLKPTSSQKEGGHKVKCSGLWLYRVPVPSQKPLDEHIMVLWDAIRPQIPYLRELKKKFQVGILCQYVGFLFRGGFELDQRCIGLFKELDIPLKIGVRIDPTYMARLATDNESPQPPAPGTASSTSWFAAFCRWCLSFLPWSRYP